MNETLKERLYNVKVYSSMMLAAIQSRIEYRGSFFIYTVTILGFYGSQIAVIGFILHRFKHMGGWSAGEVAFLYGLLVLSQGIVGALLTGLHDFSVFIREGTFDRVLLRPLSPILQIITTRFEAHGVANLILGIAALVVAQKLVDIHWTLKAVGFLFLSISGGAMIFASIRIAVGATAFFTVSTDGLQHLVVFSSREFLLYPVEIYSKPVKLFLTFLFPIAFVNFYPAHYFLLKTSDTLFHPYIVFFTFPVGLLMLFFSLLYWRFGVKHYASTGS